MAAKNKYKLKKLRTYTTKEWFVDEKMYCYVFLGKSTDYLRAELSLYNILFDEKDWSCTIKYEAYNTGKSSEKVFEYEQKCDISKAENIYNFRYGWGNKSKTHWKKGEYEWKAYVDNELVATTKFYVEDAGEVTATENPFFDIQTIKFFEDGKTAKPSKDRTYMTQFVANETRYISTELTLRNKLKTPWNCELQYYYYDENGRLRGQSNKVFKVDGEFKTTTFAWGNDSKDIWKDGAFSLEVIFMNQRIAIVPFNVGAQWMAGTPDIANSELVLGSKAARVPDDRSLEELLGTLDELVGLTEIKSQIREYIEYLKFEKIRKDKGLNSTKELKLHTVLTGNPGTGKTTVAKQLGKIYKAMGLLTIGHIHEVDRADLVGEYIGQSAPKVREAIKKARGGILFIDEAYALYRKGTRNDYGHEVIEILLKEMSDGPGNLIVVCAGYPAEMSAFINSNPGLKSRFSHFFHFPDYMPEELMAIADLGFSQRQLSVTDDAKELLFKQLTKSFRARNRSFGNARFVMSVVDESKRNMALRLMKAENTEKLTAEELSQVVKSDVQEVFATSHTKKLQLQVDNEMLKVALHELDSLIGMDNVKTEIRELVKLVTYYREIGKDVLNQFVMHSVFTGNPGTGKTTVARIFAQIFKALGLIERGHLVECDRESLVAGFTGQTAIKTAKIIDQAMGGVLFIDEAYALVNGNNDSFGHEAVQAILKRMEDNKTSFIVIAAGYPRNMHEFLSANPGLRSRFEKTITFEDYSPKELLDISIYMMDLENHLFDEEALTRLNVCLTEAFDCRDEHFGNARFVRKIVQQTIRDHNLRLADVPSLERSLEMIETITLEDLRNLPDPTTAGGTSRKIIGF
ncbi:MAG: SpoVK/Ycf46/Vps4 family AAA+-type ATPase [Flavobacteriaceae bacterium]|jgi:SpoVK/Ycf46/Vps4 family AAA+-type ATPase